MVTNPCRGDRTCLPQDITRTSLYPAFTFLGLVRNRSINLSVVIVNFAVYAVLYGLVVGLVYMLLRMRRMTFAVN